MSSLETIYLKMMPTPGPSALTGRTPEVSPPEASKQIGREVAHELNNILTIIRGYADRVMIKHGQNDALRPDLQLIADNARRAEQVIRRATPPRPPSASAASY